MSSGVHVHAPIVTVIHRHSNSTSMQKAKQAGPQPRPGAVKRRGGRRLILASVPGGVSPPVDAAVSPATAVNGKASGSLVGFRVSPQSRTVIDELVDAEGVSQRTWLVLLISRYLIALGEPPLQEPLFESRRRPSKSARPELVAAITAYLAAPAEPDHRTAHKPPHDSPGRRSAPQGLAKRSPRKGENNDVEHWMKQHAPKKGLDLIAGDIERLVSAGYDWDQIQDYVCTVKHFETTPKALWAWWQLRHSAT